MDFLSLDSLVSDILGELVAVAGKQPTPAMAAGYIQRELKIGETSVRFDCSWD